MTQTELILRHLKEYRSITSFEAFTEYGVTRLSAVIFELRRRYKIGDCWIERVNRYGTEIRFKKYIYQGELKCK